MEHRQGRWQSADPKCRCPMCHIPRTRHSHNFDLNTAALPAVVTDLKYTLVLTRPPYSFHHAFRRGKELYPHLLSHFLKVCAGTRGSFSNQFSVSARIPKPVDSR